MKYKIKCACGTTTRMTDQDAAKVMRNNHMGVIKGYTGPYSTNNNSGRLKKKKY